MFYLYPINWCIAISYIATPKVLICLSLISECLNVFKQINPIIYTIKVCIDIPKEYIRLALMCK
jgi:hypothetical protein